MIQATTTLTRAEGMTATEALALLFQGKHPDFMGSQGE